MVYGAGGSSCMMSMFASASQTAVSWRWAARHTSSSKGAGGNESTVASAESAVIDLKRSLSAYYCPTEITLPEGKSLSVDMGRRTSLVPASVDHNSTVPSIACIISSRNRTIRMSSLARCMRSTSSAAGELSKPLASPVRVRPFATPARV